MANQGHNLVGSHLKADILKDWNVFFARVVEVHILELQATFPSILHLRCHTPFIVVARLARWTSDHIRDRLECSSHLEDLSDVLKAPHHIQLDCETVQ